MTTLMYREKSFMKKAKNVLKSGECLCIVFDGWHASLISRAVPVLKEITKKSSLSEINSLSHISNAQHFYGLLILILVFTPFMVVFWLSVANDREIKVLNEKKNQVEIIVKEKI